MTQVTPSLRVIGLVSRCALQKRPGLSESRLRELLIAEQPGGAAYAVLARHQGFVETIGDAFGRNQRNSFFSGALIPAFGAMIGLESPAIVQATVFGVGSSAIALGFGLGPLLGGIVASAAGIRTGLIVAAALAFSLAVLVGFRAREPLPNHPV